MESFIKKFQVIYLRKVFLVSISVLYCSTVSYGQGAKVILGSGTISDVKYNMYEPYLHLLCEGYRLRRCVKRVSPAQLDSKIKKKGGYQIKHQNKPYSMAFTVVDWVDVFIVIQ